jgi:O-antigen biosynthesis protein
MAFGLFRRLFQREPTRQELYLQLQRGLNIERDYQEWIEKWERYGPAAGLARPPLPLMLVLIGAPTEADKAHWGEAASRAGIQQVTWLVEAVDARRMLESPADVSGRNFEYAAFFQARDRWSDLAAAYLADAMSTGARVIYGDEDQIDAGGRRYAPWFKPDFGIDLFISQSGFGRSVFFHRSAFGLAALPDDATDLDSLVYAAALAAVAVGAEPLHCPGILVHVAGDPTQTPKARALYLSGTNRLGAVGNLIDRHGSLKGAIVEPSGSQDFLRLRHPLPEPLPLVSIVIPTRDRHDLLEACIKSLDTVTNYPSKEIIVIDNDSREQATKDYFASLARRPDVRILSAPGPFNYPRLINLGAASARGEILVTLNNDIEAIEPDWLSEMVAQASRPGIGVVGCLLLYPDRSVQHAGVIIGLSGVAGHMHADAAPDDPGYAGRIVATQDLSAVTGACHVMRKSTFDELGGLDAGHLAVAYNDIDFCLRARAAGLRIIYTPHARLLHRHSASRGSDIRPERLTGYTWEREYMRGRWSQLIFDDPFHNPNLSLSGKRGRLATAPRTRRFR